MAGRGVEYTQALCKHNWQFGRQLPMSTILWKCKLCGLENVQDINEKLLTEKEL